MRTAWIHKRYGLAAVTVPALIWLLVPVAVAKAAAADEATLPKQVRALNDVRGRDTREGQLRVLIAAPAGTKKLLPVAMKIVKDKDQPLAYNATFLLARAAHELKQFEPSK